MQTLSAARLPRYFWWRPGSVRSTADTVRRAGLRLAKSLSPWGNPTVARQLSFDGRNGRKKACTRRFTRRSRQSRLSGEPAVVRRHTVVIALLFKSRRDGRLC
jgi:hypothetical protein